MRVGAGRQSGHPGEIPSLHLDQHGARQVPELMPAEDKAIKAAKFERVSRSE